MPAPPPCPDRFNFAAYVVAGSGAPDDAPAIEVWGEDGAARWSYGALRNAAARAAGAMLAAGARRGAVVFLDFGNDIETAIHFFGAGLAGLLPLPMSKALSPREAAAMTTFLSPALHLRDAEAARRAREAASPLETHVPTCAGDPAYVVMTSGTSGVPRAVCHAHRAVWARRMMWDGWYGLQPGDRLMHAGAFNWTYTLGTGLCDPLAIGATAIVPDPALPRDEFGPLIGRSGATIFAAAPGVYRQMLEGGRRIDAPRLRHGLSAGEKMAPRIADLWRAATGRDVHEALGMSECSTFISGSPARPAPPGTCGYAQAGRRIAVVDDGGAPVDDGTPGTLAIHREDEGFMLGYMHAEAELTARMSGDWFLTGDTVVRDAGGAITYLGRNDDMLNAGGIRVSPLEVEAALLEHPAITDAAALAIEVKRDTFVIAAAYVADAEIAADAFTAHLGPRLATYKHPRLFRRVPALPRNANGKLMRKALIRDFE